MQVHSCQKSKLDELEKAYLAGDSDVHKIRCKNPIDPPPVELPKGYGTDKFLTGDQTWKCPYPYCETTFDSTSTANSRIKHVSRCKKKYIEKEGEQEQCGFERYGRPLGRRKGVYFSLTCERCQEAGGHRQRQGTSTATDHGNWLDLGVNDLVCASASDDESSVKEAVWKLEHIFSVQELNDLGRQMCDGVKCGLAACSKWVKDGEEWYCCVDCQGA